MPRLTAHCVDQVEIATAEWVDWFNHRRLYEHRGVIQAEIESPPTTFRSKPNRPLELSNSEVLGPTGAFFPPAMRGG